MLLTVSACCLTDLEIPSEPEFLVEYQGRYILSFSDNELASVCKPFCPGRTAMS
jgi:hypothetical protein